MKAFIAVLVFVCSITTVVQATELESSQEIIGLNAEVESVALEKPVDEAGGIAQIKKTLLEARGPSPEPRNEFQGWRTEAEVDLKEKSFDVFKALVLCIGVFCIVIYFLKRMNKGVIGGANKRIQVLEKVQIASKTSLVLVELDGKPLLFSLGNDRVSVLNPESKSSVYSSTEELSQFSESLESVCEKDIQLSA